MFVCTRIRALSSLKRRVLAAGLGALSTVAMPPLFIWPVLFITLPLIVLLLDCERDALISAGKTAARLKLALKAGIIGWAFGTGYLVFSLYWIGASFLVEADKFAWAMPFAILLLPAAIALFYGLGFALAGLLWSNGPERIITLALGFWVADYTRSTAFTGLPWNLLGHSLTGNDTLAQSLILYGVFGLTVLAALIFASPAALLFPARGNASAKKSAIALVITSALTMSGLYGFGAWRLAAAGPKTLHENLSLFLVYPGVPQKDKVNPALRARAFEKVFTLTKTEIDKENRKAIGNEGTRLIIWPETAIPFALNQTEPFENHIKALLRPGDQLIAGGFWLEQTASETPGKIPATKVYNSLFVFNNQATITARYDKHHRVPFGEYLPWPRLFSAIGFEALVRMRGGFSAGPKPTAVPLTSGPPFFPYICYEAIFPLKTAEAIKPATWILNISNDAWFGKTAGPYQHLHFSKLRAIETGRPLVRVVNNGMTGVYDGLGRKVAQTKLGETGIMKISLPKAKIVEYQSIPNGLTIIFHIFSIFLIISTMKFFDKN